MMTNNDDTFRWDCIKGTRAIKDKISAKLNAMTSEEELLYFAELNEKAHRLVREREKVK
ncbi:MAG: hypothetical protein FWF51_01475 [Chitinivibrionia bacterium]|nr:hypothetical protein [Chitinivibrionia bacterium]